MEVSSCVVQGKKMYIVVCVATLTSRVKGFHAYKKQVDIGTKLHCELEPENSLCKKAIIIKTKEGDTVGHVPDLLVHALSPEIREFTKQQWQRQRQREMAKLFKCACACYGDSPPKTFSDHVPNVRSTIFRFPQNGNL